MGKVDESSVKMEWSPKESIHQVEFHTIITENGKRCFICGMQGEEKAILSHTLFSHRLIEIYLNEGPLSNNMDSPLTCPNSKCNNKDSIYIPAMRYHLAIHSLLDCSGSNARQNFFKNLTLEYQNKTEQNKVEIEATPDISNGQLPDLVESSGDDKAKPQLK